MKRLAVTYNLARELPPGAPHDLYAEFDSREVIEAVKKALSQCGEVHLIEADEEAYEKLEELRPHMVFNIAEGIRGESRESHIPAMLEMLGIPYTGSGPLTLAITLNKARAKEVLSYHKVPNPEFRVYNGPPSKSDDFPLPAIVKPISEGSSKGIREDSVVSTRREFMERVAQRVQEYGQPVIVEKFLDGREFTVAILGNGRPRVLPIVEVVFDDLPPESRGIDSYEAKWVWDVPEKPLDCIRCPAGIDKGLEGRIKKTTLDAYKALGCRDWSRLDMRLDENGIPNVLEVNALPGMIVDPKANSRFPAAARAAGLSYDEVILLVLKYALERYGIKR